MPSSVKESPKSIVAYKFEHNTNVLKYLRVSDVGDGDLEDKRSRFNQMRFKNIDKFPD